MNQDNALKRALIPFIKALTKAINWYAQWARAHRRASNVAVGFAVFVVIILVIAAAMTPIGVAAIWTVCLGTSAYLIGDMLNG